MLRQAVVPVINWNVCKKLNSNMQVSLTHNMLCAGELDGARDACKGDSGSPLVCKHDEHWFQYGVVNWGTGCGQKDNPGVYADVVKFLTWIQEKTGSQYSFSIVLELYLCQYILAFRVKCQYTLVRSLHKRVRVRRPGWHRWLLDITDYLPASLTPVIWWILTYYMRVAFSMYYKYNGCIY